MALDPSSVGFETSPVEYRYGWRDAVLYALSVGATADSEMDFLYEGRGPRVLPTFASVIAFAVFDPLVDRVGCDRSGVVHERQSLRFYRELPPSGTIQVIGRVDGVYDLRRMATGTFSVTLQDEDGPIAESEIGLVFKHDGGFGGSRPPKRERRTAPDKDATFEVSEPVPSNQALLYRLNGDLNPLHADPEFAKRAGFDKPILHGLCTLGYAARAVLHHACDGDPSRLRELHALFRAPVIPGETLTTRVWNDNNQISFLTERSGSEGPPAIANAYAICD